MIISTSLIGRLDNMTLEQFQRHWLDPHGPLTAKLPGTVRYEQNHVIPDAPGTNAVARAMRVDGLPVLAFDSPESRRYAHNSAEMSACNADSRQFIGAVARIISDDGDSPDPIAAQSFTKQIFLAPRGTRPINLPTIIEKLDGVCGLISHKVLEQGPAPNSTVPFIDIEVEGLAELWIRDQNAVEANSDRLKTLAPSVATFAVRVFRFL